MARSLTATIERDLGSMLRIECSDGFTYVRDSCCFRGKVRAGYSRMPTVVDRSKPLAENVDVAVAFGAMPRIVRDLMKASPANLVVGRAVRGGR